MAFHVGGPENEPGESEETSEAGREETELERLESQLEQLRLLW
jgi:hypothetical protein